MTVPARAPRPLVIAGATLVPMDGGGPRRGRSVLVEDGWIRAVAPAAELAAADAEVLDAEGRFLVPGLCDMHVHYWEPLDANLFLASGVTLVRNMWGGPLHLELRRRVELGELPGPRVVTASPVIDAPGDDGTMLWREAVSLVDPAGATALVERCARLGYDQIKAYSWLRPEVLRALGRAAAGAGLRLTGHCPEGVSFEEAVAAGMSCFEHLLGIERGRLRGGQEYPPQWRVGDRATALRRLRLSARQVDLDAVRRLAAGLAAGDVWNCPTLVLPQAVLRALDDRAGGDDLRYQTDGTVARWRASAAAGPPAPLGDEMRDLRRLRHEVQLRIVSILHAEGAPLLAGTDTPNPFVLQGRSLHDELENLVRAGLTPVEALRLATVEPARFLGRERETGTLAAGRRADLVLTRADPLRELSTLRRPDAVLVNGYRLLRPDLDRLLEERARWAAARAPDPAKASQPSG